MTAHTLVLGAERSGVTAVGRAVSQASGLSVLPMAAEFGLLHRCATAMASHRNALAAADRAIDLQPVLARFWRSLLDAQQPDRAAGVLIGAPDRLSDCPNLRAARTLMALEPDWRAIVMRRHPVGFVDSRLRAAPDADFASHCTLWANAAVQSRRLKETFGPQVLLLDHADTLDAPEDVGAAVAGFLRLGEDAARTITRSLEKAKPGRSAAFVHAGVLRLADTNWSAPEIALFRTICEEPAALRGYKLDSEGVEQARPMDLSQAFAERPRLDGGWSIGPDESFDEGPWIRCGEGGAGALQLGPVTAGRRRRFRLALAAEPADGAGELRVGVVESLSRRPILWRSFALQHTGEVKLDTVLPEHAGLLDFIFSGGASGAPSGFRLRHASLSHA